MPCAIATQAADERGIHLPILDLREPPRDRPFVQYGCAALMLLRRLLALMCLAVVPAALPATASALRSTPCKGQAGFDCATLRVPLDRSGVQPGTVGVRIAAQHLTARRRRAGVLVALSGGPGQRSVGAAGSFADTLAPLLGRYRLVVLDQRGTGASGVLRCPALQRLGAQTPSRRPPTRRAPCSSGRPEPPTRPRTRWRTSRPCGSRSACRSSR